MTSEQKSDEMCRRALAAYDGGQIQYSADLNYTSTAGTLSQDIINQYANGCQTDIDKTIAINDMIRLEINKDDIIGMVVDCVTNNINPTYRLSYSNMDSSHRNKSKQLQKAKDVIDAFNYQIDVKQVIYDAIELSYCEGNYICMLRSDGTNWSIDYLPLGVAELSGYKQNGNPVVLIKMQKLKDALKKTMIKDKKKKALFFENTLKELQANYPQEVVDAFKNNDTYAKLDARYTGVVRINNHSRRYGLSPIFRALTPMLTLRNFQDADNAGAKAKSKKIVHQVLRKEVMGTNGERKGFDAMAYAHKEFVKAWANPTVIYTSPPAVEKIVYVEPQTNDISSDKINEYRTRVLTSLGISFLANSGSLTAASANISLKQLLQSIDKISRQVERMLEHFYETVLEDNNIDPAFRPDIQILDSEMLSQEAKVELAKLLYTTFSCSRETSLGAVDINLDDELAKRQQENDDGLDDVFKPYPTSYTTSADSQNTDDTGGRPADTNSKNPDHQANDKARNDTKT